MKKLTCQARGLRAAGVPTKAKLTFIQDQSLSLQLQYKAEDMWSACFHIEHSEATPLKLPNVAYLGFSAETGELSDNFDIISVEAKNLYNPGGSAGGSGSTHAGNKPKARVKLSSSGGSWAWFFFKFFIFCGVVVGGYVGWTMYRTNKRTRF